MQQLSSQILILKKLSGSRGAGIENTQGIQNHQNRAGLVQDYRQAHPYPTGQGGDTEQ